MAALTAGWLVALAVACGACLSPGAHTCPGGGTCPEGLVCAQVSDPDQQLCVQPEQVAACTGKPDHAHCGSDGRCYGGVCLPVACGNGRVDSADPSDPGDVGEVCDDGNQTSGDGCSSDCLSDETCGNGVVDPIRGELCDDGNHIQHDGCDSRCQPETPHWVQVPLAGPTPRKGTSLAYDIKRDRFVMFGGFGQLDGKYLGDTWELQFGSWILASPLLAPAPRSDYAMAYDAARGRTVLFGGTDGQQVYDDTWEWDGTSWAPIATAVAPPPRTAASMVYDGQHHRVLLFGGVVQGPTQVQAADDLWQWDGKTWTRLAPAHSPGLRSGAAMAYDSSRGVSVLFGGSTAIDTWEYGLDPSTGLDDWKQVDLGTGPSARNGAGMVYLSTPGLGIQPEVVLFGGAFQTARLGDMWSWNGTAWTALTTAGAPSSRQRFGMASDSGGRVIVFGGDAGVAPDPTIYQWGSGQWAAESPTYPQPVDIRSEVGAAYDLERAAVVLVDVEPDTTTWELDDGAEWRSFPGGPAPSPMMAYDPVHGVTVALDVKGTTETPTWRVGDNAWTMIAGPTPPNRLDGAMAWDAANQQVLLFGGGGANGQLDDTWLWDGASWTKRTPAVSPSPRALAAIGSDPIRRQVVVFGGYDGLGSLGDTWVWDGTSWSERQVATSPSARAGATMMWNASRQRLTLFGGGSGVTLYHDVWEWDGSAWQLVDAANPPEGRAQALLFPTPDGTALYVFGGSLGPRGRVVDLWRLRWEGATPDESCREAVDDDGDGLAGCADPDCWSECTPLCPPGASCPQGSFGCGDGVCTKPLETCRLCATDCTCVARCGDSYCDPGEDATTCPGDCP